MRSLLAIALAALAVHVAMCEGGKAFLAPAPVPLHLVPTNVTFNKNVQALLKAFVNNGGLPRSYIDVLPTTNESYWTSDTYLRVGALDAYGNKVKLDSIVAIQERTLTHDGLNLYDGATWQIALSLWQLFDIAEMYERNILYPGTTGYGQLAGPSNGGSINRVYGVRQGLPNFRADTSDFAYGNKNISGNSLKTVPYPGNVTKYPFNPMTGAIMDGIKQGPGALFYRMTGPHYWMKDPLDGYFANSWNEPWPLNDPETSWDKTGYIHWNDWKPIVGENVWGTMIGPLQRLYLTNNGNLSAATCGTPENAFPCTWQSWNSTPAAVQLGISILPGLLAMQSDLGSLYHCPWGSKIYPADPEEGNNVSNENNFSAYAALTMLNEILANFTTGSTDEWLQYGLQSTTTLLQGLDNWFENYLIPSGTSLPDGTLLIPQGGHVVGSTYDPIPLTGFGGLAVDCQTWGLTVLGASRVDKMYGDGTAFKIWNATKALTGHFINGEIAGVGYTANATTANNGIWSAEWTFGAISMCQRLAQDYQASNPAWSQQLLADASSMYYYTQQPWPQGLQFPDGSYVYANARFFIPWGWYANPISATCSTAWAVMKQQNFNPFELGGGNLPQIPPFTPGTNKSF